MTYANNSDISITFCQFSIRSSDTPRSEPPQSEPQSEQRLSKALKTTLPSGDLFPFALPPRSPLLGVRPTSLLRRPTTSRKAAKSAKLRRETGRVSGGRPIASGNLTPLHPSAAACASCVKCHFSSIISSRHFPRHFATNFLPPRIYTLPGTVELTRRPNTSYVISFRLSSVCIPGIEAGESVPYNTFPFASITHLR